MAYEYSKYSEMIEFIFQNPEKLSAYFFHQVEKIEETLDEAQNMNRWPLLNPRKVRFLKHAFQLAGGDYEELERGYPD